MGLFSNLSFRKRGQPELVADAGPAAAVAAAPTPEPVVAAEPAPAVPALSAAAQARAEELVRRVGQELPTFLTVAVVEAATGRIWPGSGPALTKGQQVAAANAEVVRQTRQCLAALQLADTEQVSDVLITLRHQLHLLRVLPQADWLLYLAVRTEATNPALARAVLQAIDY